MRRALACMLLGGCASILGLDQTRFDQQDAPIDSPGNCDGPAQACTTSTTGRTLCGRLFGTGDAAGQPLQVLAASGGACIGTAGPCAFGVAAFPLSGYFDGTASPIAGTIDDCGRYAFPDLETSLTEVAVVFTSTTIEFVSSARIVANRMTVAGVDLDVDGLAIGKGTLDGWATDLGVTDLSSAYLVKYTANNAPLANVTAEFNGGSVLGEAPANPFAAYFATPFQALTKDRMTNASGTALVGFTGGLTLEGLRTGHQRCTQQVAAKAGVIVYVVETGC